MKKTVSKRVTVNIIIIILLLLVSIYFYLSLNYYDRYLLKKPVPVEKQK